MSGRRLADRYELVERIGSGGMAEVWEGIDHSLGRRVAVKMLHRHLAADPMVLLRFRSEAHAAARLTHPGIVAIYDTVTTEDTDAIIMELVDGRDLRTILDERPTLASADAVEVGVQLAAGLGHAHMNGIIHRDVKPANILVRPDRRVKLSDFGIAKALDQTSHTESGSLVGTVKYLAPEQIEGHGVDGRTDLYGLTTVLYEMLCGQVPFAAQDLMSAMDRIRRDPPSARSIRPDLPPALDQFLTKGLARNPADRYPDASTWSASLAAAMRGDQTVIEQVPAVASRPPQPAPLPPVVAPPASIPTAGPGSGPARPPSVAVRDQEQVPLAKHHRGKRSRLAFLGPLIALALMIAAVATVWMLLKPAGDAVGDRFGATDTELDDATTSTSESAEAPGVVDGTTADAEAESTTTSSTTTITVAPFIDGRRTIGFDPLGDNDEHNEAASRALDGNPSTFWYTESYTTRQFGNIKEGVGLILEFEEPQPVSSLRLSASRVGWAARVYEADEPASSLDGWGESIGGFTDLAQTAELDVPDISVTAVLLWITDVGVDPEQTPEDYDAQVAEGGSNQRLEIFEIELVG
jgi:tRNA A-37 threonylcarbamoyl transferase component Bud32